MRSATAGACGSSRRTPRPRLPPACSFFVGLFLCRIIEPGLLNMRSATAGACGSSRRLPRPRLPPACSFFLSDYQTGIIEHAVSNRRGLRLKPPHPPAKIASRMQFFLVGRRRDVPSAPWTWCFKARKTLFLRREAPRRPVRPALRRRGRGASRPANPYSFVGRHHVPEPDRPFGAVDVVLQGP